MFAHFLTFFLLFLSLSAQADTAILRLATTTSTDNSGLLQALIPPFEKQSGYKVHVIAVGTGKALRLGQEGDVDVVLVHARKAEDKFVNAGYGVNRRDVMYNDFVVVGPADDPANIRGEKNVADVFKRIAKSKHIFVSRGDTSGTHKKERALWQQTGIDPAGQWYREVGQGMGKVLQISGELGAYTLTDRGTWLAYEAKVPLKLLVAGDARLFNPYGVIAVNPAKYPHINYRGAMQLIAWLISIEGQSIIRDFRIGDKALFIPMAVKAK